jgi:hypothetical protein
MNPVLPAKNRAVADGKSSLAAPEEKYPLVVKANVVLGGLHETRVGPLVVPDPSAEIEHGIGADLPDQERE